MTLKGALLLICACLPTVLAAQHRIIAPSVNPMEDSLAVARVRAKMDSIRQYRPTVAVVLGGGGARGMAHLKRCPKVSVDVSGNDDLFGFWIVEQFHFAVPQIVLIFASR